MYIVRSLVDSDLVVPTKSSKNQALETTPVSAVFNIDPQSGSLQRALTYIVGIVMALVILFWGVHSFAQADPYIDGVLQSAGDSSRGREIFITNCATCHGLNANGEVGPDLSNVSERKSRVALIKQVISGKTPPMPQFQPNEKDMADLLSFLETL